MNGYFDTDFVNKRKYLLYFLIELSIDDIFSQEDRKNLFNTNYSQVKDGIQPYILNWLEEDNLMPHFIQTIGVIIIFLKTMIDIFFGPFVMVLTLLRDSNLK